MVAQPPADTHLWLYGDAALDELVLLKLTQPDDPSLLPEARGLGWSEGTAVATYQTLASGVDKNYWELDRAAASEVVHGLDYEDGRIFGLLMAAMGDQAWSDPVLVTNDKSFAAVVNDHAPVLTSGRPQWRAVSPYRLLKTYGAF